MADPPSQADIEIHFPLLERFMQNFQLKAPLESDIVEGISVETVSFSRACVWNWIFKASRKNGRTGTGGPNLATGWAEILKPSPSHNDCPSLFVFKQDPHPTPLR